MCNDAFSGFARVFLLLAVAALSGLTACAPLSAGPAAAGSPMTSSVISSRALLSASSSASLAPDFSALVRTYGPAVVNIGVARAGPASPETMARRAQRGGAPLDSLDEGTLGSGFIVSDDGFILTNAHVVERGKEISVKLTDRREFKARLIGADPLADVALLKIDTSGLPIVRIGDPAKVEVGNWVLAIGSPYGFSSSVTAGIVSAKGRVLPGADYMPFLQTDVPVNPGNSGGPLFNLNGEVIGINSRIYSRSGGYQGLSFAIPIDVAMRIKEQLQNHGSVTRGRIGVVLQEVTQALADSFRLPRPVGALVSYVQPGGAAERAGLKPGDVILRVRGKPVEQSADALLFIADSPPAERAAFEIWRERAPLRVEVMIDRFDAPAPAPQAAASAPDRLGIVVRALWPQERQALRIDGGLLVQRVNAAAARAQLKVGDVILAVNDQLVDTVDALTDEVGAADGAIALLVQRGSTRLFIAIEAPQAPSS